MAAIPNGMPAGAGGANAAIKAKISNGAAHAQKQDESADQKQASNSNSAGDYDPNAYLYDANSWPEYTIHDSDYSNFHTVEMSNMNGENTDMPPMYDRPNGGMEYPGGQRFPQGKAESEMFNDEEKEAKGEALQKKPSGDSSADTPSNAKVATNSGAMKPAENGGANGVSKSQSGGTPVAAAAQQLPQKPANSAPAANDVASQKQQPPQSQQQQQQAKGTPAKLAASVAQAAASLPPKAIASLVSSLVGGGKAAGATVEGQGQGQIQKNIVGTISQSLIPQDINPAAELTQSATQLHKVAKPKKH